MQETGKLEGNFADPKKDWTALTGAAHDRAHGIPQFSFGDIANPRIDVSFPIFLQKHFEIF